MFRSLGELHANCPTCGLGFEREPGYWVGSMIVNMAMTIVAFLATFGLGLALTWPEPPWLVLGITVVAVTGLTPIVAHRWSRTIWLAIEMGYHPLDDDEILNARLAMEPTGSTEGGAIEPDVDGQDDDGA